MVTGMGCVCAAGLSPAEVFTNLSKGERHLAPAQLLGEVAMGYPFFAAPQKAFAQGRLFSAKDTLQLAHYAAQQALAQAKLSAQSVASMPIMVGTTAGSALHFLQGYADSRSVSPKTLPPKAPACSGQTDTEEYFSSNLALHLVPESQGARLTLTNACTSGADALGVALDAIALGQECVLCGGADALSIVPHTGFARLMIYSEEACKPFDGTRKGLNLGEGAAFVVLESYEHALERGAEILGFVLGYGAATDAYHFTAPHPEGRGLRASIATALQQAFGERVLATDFAKDTASAWKHLAFANAHGTATPENDKVEGAVLREIAQAHDIPVWASKGSTGHTLGAAGALEAVLCLEALRQKKVPASLGFAEPDPAIGLSPTQEERSLTASCALSTSLGFGGGNAALVLGSADCLAHFSSSSLLEGAVHDTMA